MCDFMSTPGCPSRAKACWLSKGPTWGGFRVHVLGDCSEHPHSEGGSDRRLDLSRTALAWRTLIGDRKRSTS